MASHSPLAHAPGAGFPGVCVYICVCMCVYGGVCVCVCVWAALVVQMVKHLSAMQETQVQSLGWEGPLEKEMAAHSSILAWKILWTVEPGRLPSVGSQKVRQN